MRNFRQIRVTGNIRRSAWREWAQEHGVERKQPSNCACGAVPHRELPNGQGICNYCWNKQTKLQNYRYR